ncbi:ribonuclease H-like domain-containing protein, partial [Tanacetum coccineum]
MTEEEDIISLLPDCLLLEIISRLELSTKHVIKTTSTISKRWQHLWTKLPTLSFIDTDDIPNRRYNADISDYFSFIDKTLTQSPTDLNLNKFKLRIIKNSQVYTLPKSQVYSWIQHAITRNVQEVDLTIDTMSWEKFSYDHELFFNNSCLTRMELSGCAFNPPNGVIRWDKLKCLSIYGGKLDEDSMRKILFGSPCLETLERIDVTSNSVKNLVFSGYGCVWAGYIATLEIDAPYILSLTIKGTLDLEKILLLNISSLVKAELDFVSSNDFVEELGRSLEDIEDELLQGLLRNLGHVNEITLRNKCLE